jgi:hypothetical protein
LSLLFGPCGPTPSNLLSLDLFPVFFFFVDVLCEWSLGFVSIVVVHAPLTQSLESLATLLSEVAGAVLLLFTIYIYSLRFNHLICISLLSSMCPPLHSFRLPRPV